MMCKDVLPSQAAPVGGRLSEFVKGWKRITNDPYVLSIVTKGYRLRLTRIPLLRESPWEIRSPQGPEEILAMREQIPLMLQKNTVTEVPPNSPGFYSNVFLVRKAPGGWHLVIDLKSLNAHIFAPHFRMFTTSSVLSTVRKGDYSFKVDLQDAYFHVPIQPSSRSTSNLPLKTRFISFGYSLGAHSDRLPPSSRDFGYSLSGRALLPECKAWKRVARACELSSLRVLSYHRVSIFMGSLN